MNKLTCRLELDNGTVIENTFENCNVANLSGIDINTGKELTRYDVSLNDKEIISLGK